MPFNNYAPQYIFKGQVQSDTAPSANNDLIRKQDVSGLSYISSIAAGSSAYLSVDGSGALSVDSLLISDVHVDSSQSSLANFISNEGATAASLKKGDFLVLTAATGGAETYIVSGANGSVAGNYTQVESGLTAAEIVAKLTAGAGINIAANGTISSTITQYTDTNARAALSGGAGINYNSSTGQIQSTITQYTDANARASLSATGDLSYNSSTGVFNVVTYKSSNFNSDFTAKDTDALSEGSSNLYFTQARARGSFTSGSGISINGSGQISQKINTDKGVSFDAANNNALQMNISNDFAFDNSNGQLLFNLDTDGIQEGSSSLFFSNARARAAVSGGAGLAYNSSTGVFSADVGDGLLIDGSSKIGLDLGAGLEIDAGDQRLKVQDAHFRKEFASQSFTANVAKTINHNLGKKFVHVSVYDSNDSLVHAEVTLTDNNNLTVKTSDALTGVTVVVSI